MIVFFDGIIIITDFFICNVLTRTKQKLKFEYTVKLLKIYKVYSLNFFHVKDSKAVVSDVNSMSFLVCFAWLLGNKQNLIKIFPQNFFLKNIFKSLVLYPCCVHAKISHDRSIDCAMNILTLEVLIDVKRCNSDCKEYVWS